MQSPFPGMDPFIEANQLWGDFHDKLIYEIDRVLSEQLPRKYVVRLDSRSYIAIDEDAENDFLILPDISVRHRRGERGKGSVGRGKPTTTLEPPVVMLAPLEVEHRETFIEIYELRPQRQLVTGIEILSPSNKPPGTVGWDMYLRKRRAFLNGAANFIEIDLLRGGRRMPMQQEWPESPYYILVARKNQMPRCDVWPAHSHIALPEVPIPLASGDSDVKINLQPLVDAVYARARYADDIDYQQKLSISLSSEEKQILAGVSKRKTRSE